MVGQAIDCEVLIITDQEFVEGTLEAPSASQGHNVPEKVIKGESNEVVAMADGKWLGISWKQKGELIAESINLLRDLADQPRVLIVYNPKNTHEQVSISCSK